MKTISYPPYSDTIYKSILYMVDLPDWDNWKTDCRLWKGSTNEKGYPKKTIDCKQYRVHRLIAVWNDHLTDTDLDASHLCDVRKCINPNQLVLETHANNLSRRIWIPRPPKPLKPERNQHTTTVTSNPQDSNIMISMINGPQVI